MRIYLAIPYSGIEEESFAIANEVTSHLMADGHIVYSPISHNHPIAKTYSLPTGWDFWEKFDTAFVEWCDELHVVEIHNNELHSGIDLILNSKGVIAEVTIAKRLNKPVRTINYHGIK